MERRILGQTGMNVSILGFGGAEIGHEGAGISTVEQLLHSALDAGLNVIDTAECYVDSEDKIGAAVADRRQEYFLFTKCGHAAGLPGKDWDIPMLRQSIDRSLRKLRTGHVDLLQLHSCDEDVLRRGEVIEVLQKARDAGKTRFIGYSGDGEDARYAVECGAFDTLQTSINIADQEAITLTLPLAVERGMGVIAKRPIANAAWRHGGKPPSAYHHTYWDRLQDLAYPFLKEKDAAGTALRFTLSQPGVHTAIVGTTNPNRWKDNAALLTQGPLPAHEMQAIQERWSAVAGPDWAGQR